MWVIIACGISPPFHMVWNKPSHASFIMQNEKYNYVSSWDVACYPFWALVVLVGVCVALFE